MNRWKCGVCGYIHDSDERPEKCPVCEAPGERFSEELVDMSGGDGNSSVKSEEKKWRCTVCGYIHTGSEPPEKCPVCSAPAEMFLELDRNGDEIGSLPSAESEKTALPQTSPPLSSRIADLFVHHHLHPISVHFPNGILPVVFILLGASIWFNSPSMEIAAFYNLIAVLLALPLALLTGYLEWQKRYKGYKSFIFIVKIFCALVVLAATNVLVFWRIIDPGVVAADSPVKWIYFGVAALLLGAAGLAGHLGGKLAFGSRQG